MYRLFRNCIDTIGASSRARDGLLGVLPLMVGVIPFAIIAGATAASYGVAFEPWVAMNVCVFAGASQLAMLELWAQGAPVAVIVLTAGVVNLRFLLYGRVLSEHWATLKARWGLSYLLTDQAFVVTSSRLRDKDTPRDVRNLFLGVAVPMWLVWQVFSAVGHRYGAMLPQNLRLEFAVPLTFLAMAAPMLRQSAAARWTALVAALTTLVAAALPMHLGLLVGILAGVTAGTLPATRVQREAS